MIIFQNIFELLFPYLHIVYMIFMEVTLKQSSILFWLNFIFSQTGFALEQNI